MGKGRTTPSYRSSGPIVAFGNSTDTDIGIEERIRLIEHTAKEVHEIDSSRGIPIHLVEKRCSEIAVCEFMRKVSALQR